ncbi:MAG TPA: hypothetical protein VEB22_06490 [Phycisphaerales bacterium]|nr:hypothetical protein [Phycisphaerales bacterium]
MPVSRWSQLVHNHASTGTPSTTDTQTRTNWSSESTVVGQARETLSLNTAVISVNAQTSGWYAQGGIHHPSFSSYSSRVDAVLTFDILTLATYQLTGQLGHGFSSAMVDFRLLGAAAPFYARESPIPFGTLDYFTSGALAPGRYVLRVVAFSPPQEMGSVGQVIANLTVVPAPTAAMILAVVTLPLTARRRR